MISYSKYEYLLKIWSLYDQRQKSWNFGHFWAAPSPKTGPRIKILVQQFFGHGKVNTIWAFKNFTSNTEGVVLSSSFGSFRALLHRWQTPNEIAPNEILHQTRSFSSILTCVLWNYDPITTYLWAWFVLIWVLGTHNMHFCNLITSHFFTIEVAKTPRSRLLQNSDLVVVFCTKRDPRFGWCLPPVNVSELFSVIIASNYSAYATHAHGPSFKTVL